MTLTPSPIASVVSEFCTPRGARAPHDFSMKGPDGLIRCWHCIALSPRSREIQARRTADAITALGEKK